MLLDARELLRHDFDPLREREDFRQLQDDLKSRAEIRTGGFLVCGFETRCVIIRSAGRRSPFSSSQGPISVIRYAIATSAPFTPPLSRPRSVVEASDESALIVKAIGTIDETRDYLKL